MEQLSVIFCIKVILNCMAEFTVKLNLFYILLKYLVQIYKWVLESANVLISAESLEKLILSYTLNYAMVKTPGFAYKYLGILQANFLAILDK